MSLWERHVTMVAALLQVKEVMIIIDDNIINDVINDDDNNSHWVFRQGIVGDVDDH